ncbi:hypothetical protein F485_gp345 [Aeromonas phage CC2]|uniref:Uncharacterized protein n=1 Tax=Aeromonas phage CC2 TaxID=1204516 RepID=I6XHG3_9CAUD|nr:hypothetical protein F485_gp345 [Aeromonas phage CC2]AFN39531.1 hypothetical protein CC2_282 [Aeromonas phage CC2]
MKSAFLTDIDGVCVSWQSNLPFFAAEHNLPTDVIIEMMMDEKFRPMSEIFNCSPAFGEQLLRKYNESKWIRGLKPYNDALKFINENKDEFDFIGITALGTKFEVAANRMSNLNVLFPGAFREVLICDHNESKEKLFEEAFQHYGNRIVTYVDDLPHHCDMARKVLNDRCGLNIPVYEMNRRNSDKSEFVVNDFSQLVGKI